MIGPFARRRGENDGGVSAVISYLTDALRERDDVQLGGVRISPSIRRDSMDTDFGFPVFDIGIRRFGLATGFVGYQRRLQEVVREFSPDIVHGQGVDLSSLLARRSGAPWIGTVHGIIGEDARYKTRITDKLRETVSSSLIERRIIRQARSLILISPYVADYYGSAISGVTHAIPNPVGQQYFDIQARPEVGRVLYAGRLIPRKGILDLVEAFARLEVPLTRRLILAGALSDRSYVESVRLRVRELGIEGRVEFTGLLQDKDVVREFTRAQVLVLPSYQETAPMVVLQAMAASLPVVATRICGIPYQVQEGETGLLQTPGDVDELSGNLEALMSDPKRAAQMGLAGRSRAQEAFHARIVAASTMKAYWETLEQWQR